MPLNPGIAEPRVLDQHDVDDEHELIHGDPMVRVGSGKATMALIGRLLMAAIFLMSGIGKLTDLPGTVAQMTKVGIPYADNLAVVAGVAEILGALSLLFGLLTRLGAFGLILFLIPTTWYFHAFWNVAGDARMPQVVNFVKNLAIIGGLSTLVTLGAPRFSIDHRLRRARFPVPRD